MRLEKGYLHWKADLIVEQNPYEARLEHFVKLDKKDFIGKQALLAEIDRGPRKLLVSMTVDCDVAPAHGGDPVFVGEQQVGEQQVGEQQVGTVTSAGYGHRVGKNIAYAYVEPGSAAIGTPLAIGILGERYSAEVVEPILYDPDNRIPRS
jgi:dimethylglycine dehydrogenase